MSWTKEAIILPEMAAKDSTDAISQLGKLLLESGYVYDTFIQAVIDREQIFATGLPTPEIQVAIPHSDPEHVIKTAIAVGVLADPVSFGEMGSPDRTVEVRIVCVLAVKEADFLVSLLKELVAIFQDAEVLRQITSAGSAAKIAELFNHRLPEYQEE